METAILDPQPKHETPSNLTGNVWIITTRYKQERAICESLAEKHCIHTYQPRQITKRWHKITRRRWNAEKQVWDWLTRTERKDWEVKIFPRIVFAGDGGRPFADMFYAVYDLRKTLDRPGDPGVRLAKDQRRIRSDLESFEIVYQSGVGPRLQHIDKFERGKPCRVFAGPLMGAVGRIDQVGKNRRLNIYIRAIGEGRGYPLDVGMDEVEIIAEEEYERGWIGEEWGR
jgi:hypothetical protein